MIDGLLVQGIFVACRPLVRTTLYKFLLEELSSLILPLNLRMAIIWVNLAPSKDTFNVLRFNPILALYF